MTGKYLFKLASQQRLGGSYNQRQDSARVRYSICISTFVCGHPHGQHNVLCRFEEYINAGRKRENCQVVNSHVSKEAPGAKQNNCCNKRYGNKRIFHFRKTI